MDFGFQWLANFDFQLLALWSKVVVVAAGFQWLVDSGFQLLGFWSKVVVDFAFQWLADFGFHLLGLWSKVDVVIDCLLSVTGRLWLSITRWELL